MNKVEAIKQLTTAQEEALKKLKFFVESDHNFFRLSGYAGTGKSYLICHLMEWLSEDGFAFVAAAPTNKAAKNLKQIAASTGISIDVKTVAQLLGQQPEINEETGQGECPDRRLRRLAKLCFARRIYRQQ